MSGSIKIDKIYFTVKKCVTDKEAVLQKYLGNGIELIEQTENSTQDRTENNTEQIQDRTQQTERLYRITINADDTENMYLTTVYGYDIKIIIDNVKITKVTGNFQLLKNYTKKENEV